MRYDAREAVLAELTTLGLYRETKDNPMSIPLCRCVLSMRRCPPQSGHWRADSANKPIFPQTSGCPKQAAGGPMPQTSRFPPQAADGPGSRGPGSRGPGSRGLCA